MMRSRRIAWLALACSIAASASYGQKAAGPSATVIMQNVQKGFEGVKDFVVSLEADVDMERVRMPKMIATLYFKKPDKVHLVSPSFAMLPREGIVLNPAVLSERYAITLEGKDTVDGTDCFKLLLKARESRVRPAQLHLWIDPASWTIARMESTPYQGRFLRLDMKYGSQGGGIWLPEMLTAKFEALVRDTSSVQLDLDIQGEPRPDQPRRPPRSGKITVRYRDYKVNVGLEDEVFEKKEGVPKSD